MTTSPKRSSNWPHDRKTKFRVYQDVGVPEYWIVDYRRKTVEVFVLEKGEYALQKGVLGVGEVAESHVLGGFRVEVGEIFRDV